VRTIGLIMFPVLRGINTDFIPFEDAYAQMSCLCETAMSRLVEGEEINGDVPPPPIDKKAQGVNPKPLPTR
jgi:hypothetical protein